MVYLKSGNTIRGFSSEHAERLLSKYDDWVKATIKEIKVYKKEVDGKVKDNRTDKEQESSISMGFTETTE